MNTRLPEDPRFNKFYDKHCKHLKLKGLRPKTNSVEKKPTIICWPGVPTAIKRSLSRRIQVKGEQQ